MVSRSKTAPITMLRISPSFLDFRLSKFYFVLIWQMASPIDCTWRDGTAWDWPMMFGDFIDRPSSISFIACKILAWTGFRPIFDGWALGPLKDYIRCISLKTNPYTFPRYWAHCAGFHWSVAYSSSSLMLFYSVWKFQLKNRIDFSLLFESLIYLCLI